MNDHFFLYDFFVLRAPTFSIESLLDLNEVLNNIEKDNADDGAWASLRAAFSHPLFVEAIYFASKDLYSALRDWLEGKERDRSKIFKLLRSLHRYYSRMCTRCTPYGLFAGCACGEISGKPSRIQFGDQKNRRHARFDMGFVAELVNKITETPEIRSQLRFQVNNTLYFSGTKYVYVETIIKNGKYNYILTGLSPSPYIDAVIELAGSGATIEELVAGISHGDVDKEDLKNFIHSLIRVQVLVSELQPTVTGEDFLADLLHRLGELDHTSTIRESLGKAYRTFSNEAAMLDDYSETERIAKELVPNEKLEIIQEDVFYTMEDNHINDKVIEDIVRTSERLWATVPPRVPTYLEEFMHRFRERYEEQEVPLVKALDPDIGVGYGLAVSGVAENMPLLNGLAIRTAGEEVTVKGVFGKILSEKIKLFFKEKTPVISLTEEDIDRLIAENSVSRRPVQHTSAYVFGSILASSHKDLDEGNYRFVAIQLHAYSVSKLLGRFAHDKLLQEKLKRCIGDEEMANPGTILAEVVHLPEGHVANVVVRPKLRPYEIPYLAESSVEKQYEININDLMVSVKDNRVILRSRKHDRMVLPQIASALNAHMGQPIYRFLCEVRSQYIVPGFSWDWTGYSDEPYLPRVEYKNFILFRARWVLKRERDEVLSTPGKIDAYLAKLRGELNIPRYVTLAQDGDNELFIDFDNAFCRHHVAQSLKKRNVILLEFLHMPENCFIRDEKGCYNNQIIIPLGTRRPAFPVTNNAFTDAPAHKTGITRSFPPGSEWLYIKAYGGNKMLERLLVDVMKPFIEKALEEKAIDKWFFVRYNDPDSHLRIRFHQSENRTAWIELLPALNKMVAPLINNHQIAKMTVDTYVRELERYGTSTIVESESMFFFDSMAIVGFLDQIHGDEGEQWRWQIGLYDIDCLLNDFNFSLQDKSEIAGSLKDTFFQEFSNNNKYDALRLERSLNEKYRLHSPQIKKILTADFSPEAGDLADCFQKRSRDHQKTIAALSGKLSVFEDPHSAMKRLATSYIHMTMNRLFLSRRRAHELVLYHYLSKYYRSSIARENIRQNTLYDAI